MKITYVKKILRGLRYCSLPKLIDRHIEICSLESVEADIFSILGGDLPADSRFVSPERIYLEGAMAKYGIVDAKFSRPKIKILLPKTCLKLTMKMLDF